jgi:hypothetical protein
MNDKLLTGKAGGIRKFSVTAGNTAMHSVYSTFDSARPRPVNPGGFAWIS